MRVNLEELRPYTAYIISVHAVTVEPGPELTTNFTTEQDGDTGLPKLSGSNATFPPKALVLWDHVRDDGINVPEGTPTALNYSKGTGDEYVIFWGPVPCELANGVVRRYYMELDSADPWESRLVNHTTGDMRLVFSDLLPYTRYRAKVYAENDAGRSKVAAELNFTTSPAAPNEVRQLQITRSFARQASFAWLPPATPNGRIRDYGVAYRPLRLVLPCSPIEQTETKLVVPMSSQRVNLEDLRPYTVYIISVHAVTVKPGPDFTSNFTTEQDVPEGTPTALNYSKGTGDEYVIFWGPVPCELANGVVRRYYLELDSADPWESRLLNHTTGDMRLVFSDLLPYTRYRAKVFAENDAGRSQVAAELNFTTSPAVVYRPLRLVLPCSAIEQTETKLIVPMSSQRVNLEELRPYTVYIISVHAVTVKPGPEFTTNFTTEQAVPEGTPTALNYSKGTGDEYVIFWGPVPCELANGVVRRYYLELDSADPWESRLLNHTTGDMRLVFSDLLPYTRYRAKVFAENDAGRSQVAAELNLTTLPAGTISVER
ncbi:cell adhesion molecule, putative [Ixodes scapularis]|uniref:Cell adhesion molecule, putative n=1 Tax=Ixodes scapularis TaxID=6945 RepID=B7QI28_IXOSC|nr:cell adhesion molecule, putative [Ixodes scapularis]|eukprot:XP_002414835.1 cell adhesion molecule, putative [Ixodes scapularis]